jgi:hypothetical protein
VLHRIDQGERVGVPCECARCPATQPVGEEKGGMV